MRPRTQNVIHAQVDKPSALLKIVRRMAQMTIAWLALGAFLGFNMALHAGGGGAAIIAQMIAGMIVLSLLGMLLGLAVDRGRESIIGGAFGAIVGILGGSLHRVAAQGEVISLCIVIGALIGATCWPWVGVAVKILSLAGSRVKRMAVDSSGNTEDSDLFDTLAEEHCHNTVRSLVDSIQKERHEAAVSSEGVTGQDASQDEDRRSFAHTAPSESC
jgi:hypothetical protein